MRHLQCAVALGLALALAGCASVAPPEPSVQPPPATAPLAAAGHSARAEPAGVQPSSRPPLAGRVVARDQRFVVYEVGGGDTLGALAQRFLGSADRADEIAALSGVDRAVAGDWLAISLRPLNPGGVLPDGYQTVPVLAYHRLGPVPGKMTVTPGAFAAQLEYLARSGYSVVRMSALEDFLAGKRALPEKAIVLTFDDGYASTYQHAFPLLKKHGFPATIFVYTDFLGARDALSWPQMREMVASGLLEIQPHSKSHANLTHRLPGETDERYRARVDSEVRYPRELIQRNLSAPVWTFAFPYGDANELVLDRLARSDYRLAFTVNPGGNGFFAPPLALRRTMIFGDRDLEAFRASLQVFRPLNGQ